jgi:aldehyde dehydrogenase (NAD+)
MTTDHQQLFLGGQWCQPSTSGRLTITSPVTAEPIGSVPAAAPADADHAVAAARAALQAPAWGGLSTDDRRSVMHRLADALERRGGELARLVTAQNGMPISISSAIEGATPPGLLRYYAELAPSALAEEQRPTLDGSSPNLVRREPVGVVAAITPWNFPASLAAFKYAPALAAGNTVVLKPSPETVLDAYLLAEAALEAGLPPGVLSVLPGDRDLGAYLVAHTGIDKVAFTGSTAAGRQIGETAGRLLKPVTLELGGKSAAIVLDDADLTTTVQGLATVSLLNSGQTCYASTRILAPRSRYEEVLDAVTTMAASLPVGDPADPATVIGPLVSERQRDRVEALIAGGTADGAKLTTGGGRPAGLTTGWYVEPTVFGNVDNHSTIAREEIFGPVLSVIEYDGDDQAVALANDSEFGLGGSVWTADHDRGVALARRIETGTVGLNGFAMDLNAPFGGVKASGLGRELGPEGLSAYLSVKTILR